MSLHPIHQYHTEVEKISRFGSTANETAIHSVLFYNMNIGLWVYGNHSIAFDETLWNMTRLLWINLRILKPLSNKNKP